MPGETNVTQHQLEVFDRDSKARVVMKGEKFKDQSIQIQTARGSAIAREKEIKGWTRQKKEGLINDINPKWKFLNEEV